MASMSVLIVEHDTHYTERLSALFESHGALVHTADEGHRAMAMLHEQRPDLIVLAIELPTISGYSICKKLKRHKEYRQIPLFLISSSATAETFTQHSKLKTRAQEYFIKPFEPDELWARVEQHVELRQPEPELEQPELEHLEYAQHELGRDEPLNSDSVHDASFELVEELKDNLDLQFAEPDAQPPQDPSGEGELDSPYDDQPDIINTSDPFAINPPQDVESPQEVDELHLQDPQPPHHQEASPYPFDLVQHDTAEHEAPHEDDAPSSPQGAFDETLTSPYESHSEGRTLQKPGASSYDEHHTPFTSNTSLPSRTQSREIPARRLSQDNIEITILNRKLERRQKDYDALRDEYDQLSRQLREFTHNNDSAARQALELRQRLNERERELHEHRQHLEDAEITEEHLRASLQQTLDRCDELSVLLDEVTHRQEGLQSELSDARHAHKLTNERAQQKMQALHDEVTQRRHTEQDLRKQLLQKEQALKKLRHGLQQEHAKTQKSLQHARQLEETLNDSQKLLQDAQRQLANERDAWTGERDALEAKHLELAQENDTLKQHNLTLSEERDNFQLLLTQQQQEASTLQAALSAETSALNELQDDQELINAERMSLQDRLSELQKQHEDELKRLQHLSASLHALTQERDALHKESGDAHSRIELLREQLEASVTRAEDLYSHFERAHAEHQMEAAQADAELEEFENTQQALKDERDALALNYSELQRAYDELKETHDASLRLQASQQLDSAQMLLNSDSPPPPPQQNHHSDFTEDPAHSDFLDDVDELSESPESLQIASQVLEGLTSMDEDDALTTTEKPPADLDDDLDLEDLEEDLDLEDLDENLEDLDEDLEDLNEDLEDLNENLEDLDEDLDLEDLEEDLDLEDLDEDLEDLDEDLEDLNENLEDLDLDDLDDMAMVDIGDEPLISDDEQLLIDHLSGEDVIVDEIIIEE